MVKRYREETVNRLVIVSLVAILATFFLGYYFGNILNKDDKQKIETNDVANFVGDGVRYVTLMVPAVDNEGRGVATNIVVGIMPGTGRTLTDIDTLLFWVDTQNSIRTAKQVAANITGVNLNNYDLIFDVETDASLIGGPSAGAALTIATIAAIEDRILRNDVMITGSVNHDGTIGPVGGIAEKAKAAKEQKHRLFLVPLLQSREVVYETKEHCEKIGFTEICTIEQVPVKIDVNKEAGIEVKEVGSIEEAMQYFFVS